MEEIGIDDSSRYPPDKYHPERNPSTQYQANATFHTTLSLIISLNQQSVNSLSLTLSRVTLSSSIRVFYIDLVWRRRVISCRVVTPLPWPSPHTESSQSHSISHFSGHFWWPHQSCQSQTWNKTWIKSVCVCFVLWTTTRGWGRLFIVP